MQDLRTATIVRDLDGNAFPPRSRILSTIRSSIASRDPPSSAVALVAQKPASKSKNRQRSGPPSNPCYACGELHWLNDCPHADKKKAYLDALKALRSGAKTPTAYTASFASESSWSAWLASAQSPHSVVLDSGATHHMTGRADALFDCNAVTARPLNGVETGAKIVGVGKLKPRLSSGPIVTLDNAQHVEKLPVTLVSPGVLWSRAQITTKPTDRATLLHKDQTVATGERLANNLYILDAAVTGDRTPSSLCRPLSLPSG